MPLRELTFEFLYRGRAEFLNLESFQNLILFVINDPENILRDTLPMILVNIYWFSESENFPTLLLHLTSH